MTTSLKIWLWVLAAIVGFLIPLGMRFVLNVTDPLFYIIYAFICLAPGFWLWQKNKEKNLKDRFDLFKSVKKVTPEDFGIAKYNKYYQKRKSDEEISQKLALKIPIKIIGRPMLGKTRASYEAVKKLNGFYLLKPSLATELRFKEIQNIKFPFWVKNVVLFLDDLNKIIGRCDVDHLVNRLKKISGNLIILATCRSGKELDGLNGKKEVEGLVNTLQKIEPSLLSPEEEKELVQNLGIDLAKTKSDRTPGSIVLGLGEMKKRYDNFKEVKFILKSSKLLIEGNIFVFDEKLLRDVTRTVFGLNLERYKWEECLNNLIDNEFINKDIRPIITMQHDIYLDDVIVHDYHPNADDLKKVKELLIKEYHAPLLSNLGGWFEANGDFKTAVACCEQAIKILPNFGLAYYNLGVQLSKLKKHEEAVEKYAKAVQHGFRKADVFYNWGSALLDLSRYDEAIEKFKKVVEIDAKYYKAYAIWAVTLIGLDKPVEAKGKLKIAIELLEKQGRKKDAQLLEVLLKALEFKK